MNFWVMTGENLPQAELQRSVNAGELSQLSLIRRFSPIDAYPKEYREVNPFSDVPVLTQTRRSTGETNYNHFSIVAISRQYLRDGLNVARKHPEAYAKGLIRSTTVYFLSSSDYALLEPNKTAIARINRLFDRACYGKIPVRWAQLSGRPVFLFILVGLPLVTVYAFAVGVKGKSVSREQRVLILYLVLNVVYVAGVSNLIEAGENNRMRFVTDPMTIPLVGLFISRTWAVALKLKAAFVRRIADGCAWR